MSGRIPLPKTIERKTFQFGDKDLLIAEDENGEVWFRGRDVFAALDLPWPWDTFKLVNVGTIGEDGKLRGGN